MRECKICGGIAEIHPAINCYVCQQCAAQLIDGRWYGIADDFGTPDGPPSHYEKSQHHAYARFHRLGSAENWR